MTIHRRPPLPTATFPQRLRKMMAVHNLNQSEIARRVGYTSTGVWNWLKGNTLPRAETLAALATLFNVSEDWLRDGDADQIDNRETAPDVPSESIAEKVESLRVEIAALAGYDIGRVKLTLELVSH